MINEILPAQIRGRGVALATALNGGSAFRVSQFFLSLVDAIGKYNGQDLVTATINDAGVILVSRQIKQQTANDLSYRVTCAGSGC